MTEEQIKQRAKDALVTAGVDEEHAGYLAELYTNSERGQKLRAANADEIAIGEPFVCLGIGVVPIG